MAKTRRKNEKVKRMFPKKNILILAGLVLLQIAIALFVIFYTPNPLDKIDEYTVTVEPNSSGSVNIYYHIKWTPLDTEEPLTWVDIGMANKNFMFLDDYFDDVIASREKYVDGDYVSTRLTLNRPYTAGETIEFGFVVQQFDLLIEKEDGYFIDFTPGWFNAIPVEKYTFRFEASDDVTSTSCEQREGNYYVWSGSLAPGEYVRMRVDYTEDAFPHAKTADFHYFEPDAYNALNEEKVGIVIIGILFIALLLIPEIYMIDSFVSYERGRGFLRGYGHHIHIHGRVNPHYESAAEKHAAKGSRSGRGGFGGGGCACACACACAGGGRAGCSQKDTYSTEKNDEAFSLS